MTDMRERFLEDFANSVRDLPPDVYLESIAYLVARRVADAAYDFRLVGPRPSSDDFLTDLAGLLSSWQAKTPLRVPSEFVRPADPPHELAEIVRIASNLAPDQIDALAGLAFVKDVLEATGREASNGIATQKYSSLLTDDQRERLDVPRDVVEAVL